MSLKRLSNSNAFRNCSVHEKIFLRAIVSEFRRSGLEEAKLEEVINHHATLAQVDGLPPINASSLIKVSVIKSSCYQLAFFFGM